MLAGSPGDSTLKRDCASSMRRPTDNEAAKQNAPRGAPTNEAGPGRGFTGVAARVLIDTNIQVSRYDRRFPDKQSIASEVLRDGIATGNARISHQSIVEFVAATTRVGPQRQLLDMADARREAEEFMAQFPVIYPDDAVLRTALRGAAAYGLSWFNANMWAYAEVNGIEELLSEDFQHGRMYGTVGVRNSFLALTEAS